MFAGFNNFTKNPSMTNKTKQNSPVINGIKKLMWFLTR